MQKPIILLTLAYASGLLFGYGSLYFPLSAAVLACAFIVLSITVVWRRIRMNRTSSAVRLVLVALPFLAGMAVYLYSALWIPSDHYTRVVPEDNAVHRITGRVASALDRDADRIGFVLECQTIDTRPVSGRVRVSIRDADEATIGYGDRIEFSGKLFIPGGFRNPRGFDFPAYLERQGIHRMAGIRHAKQFRQLLPGTGLFRTIQNWRERIRQAFISSVTGPESAILQAMVLGEEGALTDEMRDRFLAAGVTHIISISGSHLGMAAALCFGFMKLLMHLLPERRYHWLTIHADPKKLAAGITLPLVIFYTLLAGCQTATVRSLITISAALSALLLDREHALLHSLAAAALLILLPNPQALFDLSFQLSFLSVFSIACLVLLWKDLQLHSAGRMMRLMQHAALLVIISFGASLTTGPLVAHYFNQFSLAGLLSNIIIVPFAGMVVVPLGLVSGILSLFTQSLPLAGLNQYFAGLFLSMVSFFSRLPIAEFHPRSPGILWLLAYAVFIACSFIVLRAWLLGRQRPFEYSSRIPRAPLFGTVLSAAALIALSVFWFLPVQKAQVEFPDLGQGDSALIRIPGGRNILIDGGGSPDDRFDTGRRVLAPFLWNRGMSRLDLVVLSHPHPDHMNGLKFILKKFNVREVWTHGLDEDLPGYDDFVSAIDGAGTVRRIVSDKDRQISIGEANISVLHPARIFRSRERKDYAAENDRSLVLRIAFRERVLLFTGDIGMGAEKALIRTGQDLKCDLVKVAHHGSKSSSSPEFVSAVRPGLAIITAGRRNRYHHPAGEVLERYRNSGSKIYRTDTHGAIFIELDKSGLEVVAWDERELKPSAGAGWLEGEQERENWKRLWIRKWEL